MPNIINKELKELSLLGLTHELVLKLFSYNDEVGNLIWIAKINPKQNIGDIAGRVNYHRKRRDISIGGIRYKSTHIIWLYKTGTLPTSLIDHINRNSLDDRWSNLREANYSQNACNSSLRVNSSSGIKGLSWCNTYSKWRGVIYCNEKAYSKVHFDKTTVITWLQESRLRLHGKFANE